MATPNALVMKVVVAMVDDDGECRMVTVVVPPLNMICIDPFTTRACTPRA